MRTTYIPPSIQDFQKLFSPSRGGGLNDIRIYSPYSRGGGILSFLAGLAKKALPFLMNTVAPEGIAMAQQVMEDVNSGRQNMRQALKTRGIQSLRNVGSRIAKGGGRGRGEGGRKIKRLQNIQKKNKKKKCFNDVFSAI